MPIKRKTGVKRKLKGGNSDVSQLVHDLMVKKNKADEKKIKEAVKEVVKQDEEKKQDGEGKKKRRKLRGGMPSQIKSMHGEGWSDFTDWVSNAAKDTGNFIKNNKLLSTAAGFIPGIGGTVASTGLKLVGLGHKRKRKNILKF